MYIKKIWSNVSKTTPLYGADVKGTLFKDNSNYAWDLNKLDSVLNDGLDNMKMAGVTTPYLYIGGIGTLFGWHVEDLNLPSINYNHYGKPKFWYSIGRQDFRKFESFVKIYFPQEFLMCSQYLRHKTILINPYFVKHYLPNINIKKTIQYPGEFVITFNSGYHTGFNMGFNIAEAVNFATPDWLPQFPKFKPCQCQKGNVQIDHDYFLENLDNRSFYKNNKHFKEFKEYVLQKNKNQKVKKITKNKDKRVLRSGGRKMGFTFKSKQKIKN